MDNHENQGNGNAPEQNEPSPQNQKNPKRHDFIVDILRIAGIVLLIAIGIPLVLFGVCTLIFSFQGI